MPALVTVTVLAALVPPVSWSPKATFPLCEKAGTTPPNSLPISANVLDWTPPAGRPGPSTRKKVVPRGAPAPRPLGDGAADDPGGRRGPARRGAEERAIA